MTERTIAVGVSLTPSLCDRTDVHAGEIGRSRSWIIREALEEYLDRRAKIKDAIDNTSPTTEVPKQ
jgi:predicted transcriptional regulator